MGANAKSGTTRLGLIGVIGLLLAGCGLLPPLGGSGEKGTRADPDVSDRADVVQPTPAGRFEEPGELDRLVDAKPINFPAVKPMSAAASPASAKSTAEVPAGRGRFRIQVGAENDIDAAQGKKAEYERKLGGTVDVVFDAPYYKLRWGYFETKQDADDKILEISEFNIQGFVVKQ